MNRALRACDSNAVSMRAARMLIRRLYSIVTAFT
jgi:hypothetical protein